MPQLRRLTREDEAALLVFELENREYFAQSISDRGDQFFEHFADHHEALMVDQDAGTGIFHILVEDDGTVVGRVNLYDLKNGSADVGYRISARVVGRGVATAAVQSAIALATNEYGLRRLAAVVTDTNLASKKVLEKCGFVAVAATQINDRPATRYELELGDAG